MSNKQTAALTNKHSKAPKKSMADLSSLLSTRGAEALSKIQASTPRPANRTTNRLPDFLNRMTPITGVDGVDHINTSSLATTAIGKVLGLFDPNPYFDRLLGIEVQSLLAMQTFLKTGARRVGILRKAKINGRVKAEDLKAIPDTAALMAHAMYEKICSNQDFRDLLIEVNVPLDWYLRSQTDHKLHRNNEGAAYLSALREIRQALLQNREPSLWKFLDSEEQRNKISKMKPNERYPAFLDLMRVRLADSISYIESTKNAAAAEQRTQVTMEIDPAADPAAAPAQTLAPAQPAAELTGEQQDELLRQAQADGTLADMGALRPAQQVDLGKRNGPLSRFSPAAEGISEPPRQAPAAEKPAEVEVEKVEDDAPATADDLALIQQVAEKAGD